MSEIIKIKNKHSNQGNFFRNMDKFEWLDEDRLEQIKKKNLGKDILCNNCMYSLIIELDQGTFEYDDECNFSSISEDYKQLDEALMQYTSEQSLNIDADNDYAFLNFTMAEGNILVISQYPGQMGVDFFIKQPYRRFN